jgi:phosphoenolpyruvate carboxykinase (GTP)
MIKRVEGQVDADETAIGKLPRHGDLNTEGLGLSEAAVNGLLHIDRIAWQSELASIGEYLDSFGAHLPTALKAEQDHVLTSLRLTTAEPAVAAIV